MLTIDDLVDLLRSGSAFLDENDGPRLAAEIDRLRAHREAVLAIHHSTPVWFVVGNRREQRDCCAGCEEGTYWPCLTAQAVGISGQAQGSNVEP